MKSPSLATITFFLLLCWLAIVFTANAGEDGGPDMVDGPPTQKAIEIFLEADGETMQARKVLVPEVTGGVPLVCHRAPKAAARRVTCFYVNKETGQVVLKSVLTNDENV